MIRAAYIAPETVYAAYIVLMAVIVGGCFFTRKCMIQLAAATILILWTWGEAVAWLTWETPTALYLVTDLTTAAVFLWFGARWFPATLILQALLAYFQLICPLPEMTFFYVHAASAYLQLAVLLGWWICENKRDV